PRSRPPLIVSRPRTTGAPGKRLRVNTAAADASTSLVQSTRSGASAFRPTYLLAHRKPRGNRGTACKVMAGSAGIGTEGSDERPAPRSFPSCETNFVETLMTRHRVFPVVLVALGLA